MTASIFVVSTLLFGGFQSFFFFFALQNAPGILYTKHNLFHWWYISHSRSLSVVCGRVAGVWGWLEWGWERKSADQFSAGMQGLKDSPSVESSDNAPVPCRHPSLCCNNWLMTANKWTWHKRGVPESVKWRCVNWPSHWILPHHVLRYAYGLLCHEWSSSQW